jgi:F-type H+-transporting ATPase subunit a
VDFGIRTFFTVTIPGLPGVSIPVTHSMLTTWAIMLFLILLAYGAVRRLDAVPGSLQNSMEILVEGADWLVASTMGVDKKGFAPYVMALGMYLVVANMTGLVGVRMPTADLNTTFALSLLTFFLSQYFSWRQKGLKGYLGRFFRPLPFLFPLNIIGELANPVSLGFRLFGNMLGGLIIMGLVYSFVPVIIPVVPHIYFDFFVGLIQAFIFVMLTMTYIALAMD